MVIDDADVVGVAVLPAEDDPPLVIDADRVVPLQIAPQLLEVVGGRNAQVMQACSRMERLQFALGTPGDAVKGPDDLILEEPLSLSVSERPDHTGNVPNTGMRSRGRSLL